jgi:hypothetical protein
MDEFDLILKELRLARGGIEEAILKGDAGDYPAYRQLIGERLGFIKAEQAVEDLRNSLSRQEQ